MNKLILLVFPLFLALAVTGHAPVSMAQSMPGWSVDTTDKDGNTMHHPRHWSFTKAKSVCKKYKESGRGECKPVSNAVGFIADPSDPDDPCNDPIIRC